MIKIRMDFDLELYFPVTMCDWCDKEIENPSEGAALFKAGALTREKPYISVYFFHLYDCTEAYKKTLPDYSWEDYRWLPINTFTEYFYSAAAFQTEKHKLESDFENPEML